jgi:thioredoxin reductase
MPFDVIVAGGGPAGLSAALMLGRCRRRVLVCDRGQPRNRLSRALHGYLTRDGIAPVEFGDLARAELAPYDVRCRAIGVLTARRSSDGFDVTLDDGTHEAALFLLIATGVADELPNVPGLADCYGRSVFHCPYCDGWEWREQRLAVLGQRVDGARLALSLKTWSHDIVLLSDGGRLPSDIRDRLQRNDVPIRRERLLRLDHVDGMVRTVRFDGGEPLDRDALFFSTGQHSQCNLAVDVGCAFNQKGTVRTGTLSNTNVPGVFVAGDASRDAQFVVVAAAEGVKAALAINQALQRRELKP